VADAAFQADAFQNDAFQMAVATAGALIVDIRRRRREH